MSMNYESVIKPFAVWDLIFVMTEMQDEISRMKFLFIRVSVLEGFLQPLIFVQ